MFKSLFKTLVLVFLTANLGYSQSFIDAMIVTREGDTLNQKIQVGKIIFSKCAIGLNGFLEGVNLIDSNKNFVRRIKAKNISLLRFKDLCGTEQTWVYNGSALKHLVYDGIKLKYYYDFSTISGVDYSRLMMQCIQDDRGDIHWIKVFSFRNDLLKLTKNHPELVKDIESMRNNEKDIIKIIKRYDQILAHQ